MLCFVILIITTTVLFQISWLCNHFIHALLFTIRVYWQNIVSHVNPTDSLAGHRRHRVLTSDSENKLKLIDAGCASLTANAAWLLTSTQRSWDCQGPRSDRSGRIGRGYPGEQTDGQMLPNVLSPCFLIDNNTNISQWYGVWLFTTDKTAF